MWKAAPDPGEGPSGSEPSAGPPSLVVLVAYAAPALSSSLVFTLVSLYLLKYSTDVLLIAPATVGLIFGIARFWDGVTDPLVGHLSDRTRTRWGRRRPWLVASAGPVAITYLAIWAPPSGLAGTALVAWLCAAILLFYTAITIFNVPYSALGAELSEGYHARTRIFGAKALGENLGIVVAAGSLLWIERAADARAAASTAAVFAGLLVVVTIALAFTALREPARHQGRGGRRSPYASFGDVLRNPDARLLLGVFFLEMLGYQGFVVLLPYLTEYILETPGATAFYLFGAIGATLATIPFWVLASRRIDKARLWRASLGVKCGVFLGIAFVGPGDQLLIASLTLVFGAASGAGAVLGPSLKADVVDSDEAATGERKEGTFFAAWGLAMKMATGIAILLSGLVLSATGFRPNVAQTPEALSGIRLLVSLFPALCHAVAIALLGWVRMSESTHREIRRRIRDRCSSPAPAS